MHCLTLCLGKLKPKQEEIRICVSRVLAHGSSLGGQGRTGRAGVAGERQQKSVMDPARAPRSQLLTPWRARHEGDASSEQNLPNYGIWGCVSNRGISRRPLEKLLGQRTSTLCDTVVGFIAPLASRLSFCYFVDAHTGGLLGQTVVSS